MKAIVLLVAALVALAMGAPAPGPSPHPNPNPAFLAAAPVLTPLTYSSTYNYRSPYYSAYSPYAVSPYAYNLGYASAYSYGGYPAYTPYSYVI